jgi:hypothetical protein
MNDNGNYWSSIPEKTSCSEDIGTAEIRRLYWILSLLRIRASQTGTLAEICAAGFHWGSIWMSLRSVKYGSFLYEEVTLSVNGREVAETPVMAKDRTD